MTHIRARRLYGLLSIPVIVVTLMVAHRGTPLAVARTGEAGSDSTGSSKCLNCHQKISPALVMEWQRSRHAQNGIGCRECHEAGEGDIDGWMHNGVLVSALVTPKDCARCHDQEYQQFARSHHAKAGQILASLDNILAERVAGMPGNNADAVNGCWQCHGTIVKFLRDKQGHIRGTGMENKPMIDPATWPNSGMGRMNPDGSEGSCHACHSRHSFEAKLSRSPENCSKCHMGPDHPQIEIYNESKHGIAFSANREKMALEKEGEWVLGRDYSAAPTCATCHISSYMTPSGVAAGNTHDVGERISWTLRPAISKKQNLIIFTDGQKEDYPVDRPLPTVGEQVEMTDKVVEQEKLVSRKVKRTVEKVVNWQDRRKAMKGVCLNCHADTYVDNFYIQFDDLVSLYNDKFAGPATTMIADMIADSILTPNAPFEREIQWVYWELWHHEGRRARHGASMMGPDYTHWHGMYEVSKHYYTRFLPEVISTAGTKGEKMRLKYQRIVEKILMQDEHIWMKGLSQQEVEELRKTYQQRYNQ